MNTTLPWHAVYITLNTFCIVYFRNTLVTKLFRNRRKKRTNSINKQEGKCNFYDMNFLYILKFVIIKYQAFH